ncbi:MAG TPA: homoserine kinase [Candidatus Dormibacteraeota bacterium]
MTRVRVRVAVPASVANLGPGFDILALAVQLQNEVSCEQRDDDVVTVDPGDVADDELRDPARNLVTRSYLHACAVLGISDVGASFHCVNRIPFGRGLGSSAAAALSGVLVAAALHRAPWDEQAVLDHVAELEGHRDNAAAALLGGLAICAPGAPAVQLSVPDELRVVVFAPDSQMPTREARQVVPHEFSRSDAVFNASRCALLVRALALRDWATLGPAMEDRWHQPPRSALMPALLPMIEAARAAGAAGAALAGAGPSVAALTVRDHDAVGAAMQRAAADHRVGGTVLTLSPRNFGARVDLRP